MIKDTAAILDALGLRPRHGTGTADWVQNWMADTPGAFPLAGEGAYPTSDAVQRLVDIALDAETTDRSRALRAVYGIGYVTARGPYADDYPHEREHLARLTPFLADHLVVFRRLHDTLKRMRPQERPAFIAELQDELHARGVEVPRALSR